MQNKFSFAIFTIHRLNLTNTANTSGTSGSSIFGRLSGIPNSAINCGNSNRLTTSSTENIINNPTSQSQH
jgi:hypothetical protein